MRKNERTVTPSSGNVFTDLGIAEAEERQTKVRLTLAINQTLDEGHLSQAEAARRLGINQPKISALSNYRLAGLSVQRLMHFLTAPGRDDRGPGAPLESLSLRLEARRMRMSST